jgi:hypothetical protein
VKKYRLPAATLMAANKLDKPEVRVGDFLIVPLGGGAAMAPAPLPPATPSGANRGSGTLVRTVAATGIRSGNSDPKPRVDTVMVVRGTVN